MGICGLFLGHQPIEVCTEQDRIPRYVNWMATSSVYFCTHFAHQLSYNGSVPVEYLCKTGTLDAKRFYQLAMIRSVPLSLGSRRRPTWNQHV